MKPQSSNERRPLVAYIRETTGLNPMGCYQCGKCSAGCPMGSEMPLPPHSIMRMVMTDGRDRLFADDSIWLCLTCETCSARCPNACDPARVIDALRELAVAEGVEHAPRAIRAFHQAFLDQIKMGGRLYEAGLVMDYKLRSGALLQDVTAAPGMLRRGKLPLAPPRIKGSADVRRLIEACAAESSARARSRARAGGSTPRAGGPS